LPSSQAIAPPDSTSNKPIPPVRLLTLYQKPAQRLEQDLEPHYIDGNTSPHLLTPAEEDEAVQLIAPAQDNRALTWSKEANKLSNITMANAPLVTNNMAFT
jgi:hypothetical protein